MDTVNTETRSRMMASIKSKDTQPEMQLRHRLFRLGFRYRLHQGQMPGKPDMVFPKFRAVLFVNGCFWHNHECRAVKMPSTRKEWWRKKLEGNRKRDMTALRLLHKEGWRTLVVWECSIRRKSGTDVAIQRVCGRIAEFLKSKRKSGVISGR